MPEQLVIGITGAIATGKSCVMALLRERGAITFDADLVYRELIAPGAQLNGAIADLFGPDVLTEQGEINRRALGNIVFADREALARLDRLTHPAIVSEVEQRVIASNADLIVIEAVKLSEGGLRRICDETWLITCDTAIQLQRLMQRNALDEAEARRRIAAQPVYDRSNFTHVIDNSGDQAALAKLINDLLPTPFKS